VTITSASVEQMQFMRELVDWAKTKPTILGHCVFCFGKDWHREGCLYVRAKELFQKGGEE